MPRKLCLKCNFAGGVQNVAGTTLNINVVVLHPFLQLITLYNFSGFHLDGRSIKLF
jgi:hypothetical protein